MNSTDPMNSCTASDFRYRIKSSPPDLKHQEDVFGLLSRLKFPVFILSDCFSFVHRPVGTIASWPPRVRNHCSSDPPPYRESRYRGGRNQYIATGLWGSPSLTIVGFRFLNQLYFGPWNFTNDWTKLDFLVSRKPIQLKNRLLFRKFWWITILEDFRGSCNDFPNDWIDLVFFQKLKNSTSDLKLRFTHWDRPIVGLNYPSK